MKWNCIGVKQAIERIEDFLANSKKADKNYIAYKALKAQDSVITALMADSDNDMRCLMSYRRQVRTLLKQIGA